MTLESREQTNSSGNRVHELEAGERRRDVEGAGLVKVVSKSMYPAFIPQQPSDFVQPPPVVENPRNRNPKQLVQPPTGGGRWMADWSGPPVNASSRPSGAKDMAAILSPVPPTSDSEASVVEMR